MMSSLKLFLILYYIKQIHVDSKLLCICSVIDHRWCQNVVRTSVTHSTAPCVPLFCSYHILMSSVIYYWTDTQQLGIYLLNRFHITMWLLSNQSQMMSELWWERKKHTRCSQVWHWCSYSLLTSSVMWSCTDPQQHVIYLFYMIN